MQRFCLSHKDDIISLAMHPEGEYVATGELGRKPRIIVWDSAGSIRVLQIIEGYHTRGVNLLRFSKAGDRLVSAGLDRYHSIAVWHWSTNTMLCSFPGGLLKVLDIEITPNGFGVVQCGVKHIKFHSLQGRNVVSQRGLLGKKGKIQNMLCVAWVGNRALAGTADGRLYVFEGRRLIQSFVAHETSVNCVFSCSQGVVSGGKDGIVKVWSSTLEMRREIKVGQFGSLRPSVRSVCWDDADNRVLVGTRGCELFEFNSATGQDLNKGPIVQGHCAFELWGVSMHPFRKEFCTVGDDQTVRIWSLAHRRCLKQTKLDTMARAVSYDPTGNKIVVGLGGRVGKGRQKKDGAFVVLNEDDLSVAYESRDAKQWISDVKFSPDQNTLAIGSHDNNIYLYDVPNAFELKAVMDKHNSYIHQFDFSADSQYMQSVCGAYELICSDPNTGTFIPAMSTLKDVRWETWTMPVGWPVKGVWPMYMEGTEIRTLDRSHYGNLLATGDNFGRLRLWRYPCIDVTAGNRTFVGHSEKINKVRFAPEDDYLISIGGSDKSIFQWKIIPAELDEAIQAEDSGIDSDLEREGVFEDDDDEDDDFLAIKPWVSTIVPPTVPPLASPSPPDVKLELEFVYGRRAQDVRNNMFYSISGQAIYHTAAVGIIYDKVNNSQQFYTGHTANIMCLAISPCGHYVATGQEGTKTVRPTIHIWNALNGQPIAVLREFHRTAVALLAFSQDGHHLVSVGHDINHQHAVWYSDNGNWSDTVLQASHKGVRNKTLCASFIGAGEYQLVSGAVNSVTFWQLKGKVLHPTEGIFGRKAKSNPYSLWAPLAGRSSLVPSAVTSMYGRITR